MNSADDAPPTSVKDRLLDVATKLLWPFLLPFVASRTTQTFRVFHQSMLPAFHPGDHILVLLLAHCGDPPLVRDDFVVFKSWHEDEDFALKRIIAVPGQEIAVDRHVVYVDGKPLDEPYATGPTHGTVPPMRLGPGEYFVMGDNRTQSCDSRVHGPIRLDDVHGRPFFRSWPPRRMGMVYREVGGREGGGGEGGEGDEGGEGGEGDEGREGREGGEGGEGGEGREGREGGEGGEGDERDARSGEGRG